jgi:hypothetical protein
MTDSVNLEAFCEVRGRVMRQRGYQCPADVRDEGG